MTRTTSLDESGQQRAHEVLMAPLVARSKARPTAHTESVGPMPPLRIAGRSRIVGEGHGEADPLATVALGQEYTESTDTGDGVVDHGAVPVAWTEGSIPDDDTPSEAWAIVAEASGTVEAGASVPDGGDEPFDGQIVDEIAGVEEPAHVSSEEGWDDVVSGADDTVIQTEAADASGDAAPLRAEETRGDDEDIDGIVREEMGQPVPALGSPGTDPDGVRFDDYSDADPYAPDSQLEASSWGDDVPAADAPYGAVDFRHVDFVGAPDADDAVENQEDDRFDAEMGLSFADAHAAGEDEGEATEGEHEPGMDGWSEHSTVEPDLLAEPMADSWSANGVSTPSYDSAEAPSPGTADPSGMAAGHEMAARLEAIARDLRVRGPEAILAERRDDPLSALLTGYLLGLVEGRGTTGRGPDETGDEAAGEPRPE